MLTCSEKTYLGLTPIYVCKDDDHNHRYHHHNNNNKDHDDDNNNNRNVDRAVVGFVCVD